MNEPIKLRRPRQQDFGASQQVERENIPIEKGAILTSQWVDKNEDFLKKMWNYFMVYPDIYLDLITPVDSTFRLYFYQRLFLRACMRYTNVYFWACRATAKTFLAVLAKYLQCVFLPGHVGSIIAPGKKQSAEISQQKIKEIWKIWPLLEKELAIYQGKPHANMGSDYTELFFKNGSVLKVVGALDSSRGLRTHATLLDETREHDGTKIQEIIIPQMNVSRRTANGQINPKERINTQIISITSSGSKLTYAYELLLDFFQRSILDPLSSFVMGVDYRLPLRYDLINPTLIQNIKLSPTYSDQTFATEYGGVWLGGSDESWFDFEKMRRYRRLKNPEWKQKYVNNPNIFYLISADIARSSSGDQSVVCVFRVNKRNEKYYSTLVYIEVLGKDAESKTFEQQAIDIKRLISLYNPRECVIDVNGLGVGLGELLTKEQVDSQGVVWPAYGFHNDKEFAKTQPSSAPRILYAMRATAKLNSNIHSNVYTRLSSGLVHFLITEQEARTALLATKTGQKMTPVERVQRLMPHEMTTRFFEEASNLRAKRTGLDIALEQINSRIPKDKYFAFAYGLWRIKELEEEALQKHRRKFGGRSRQLVFYTGGNG